MIPTVAPLVGAWIEICLTHKEKRSLVSLPSWERGLKYKINVYAPINLWSLPSWERGLKSTALDTLVATPASLPSWERGLKSSTLFFVGIYDCRSPRGSVD